MQSQINAALEKATIASTNRHRRKTMKLQSNFAILDVKHGRKQLVKHFGDKNIALDPSLRIPVVIYGCIDGSFGRDDGVSQEFNVAVDRVQVVDPNVKLTLRAG